MPYVDPWNTPEECDHQGEWNMHIGCSHCCPCAECGALRAESQATQ